MFLVIRVVKWPMPSVLKAITMKLNSQVENGGRPQARRAKCSRGGRGWGCSGQAPCHSL